MKKIAKAMAAVMAAAVLAGTTACGSGSSSSTGASENSGAKKYTIGVAQYMTHPAMDASLKGFKEGMTAAGFEEGKNVTYDVQNAQGDQSNCVTVANTMASKKPDLILAIATPIAQSVAKVVTDTPVVITAVTDPADAKLVDSNEKPGGNVTGTSDKTPVEEQIKLIKQVVPKATTIGIMYCSSETNSKLQADWAKAACEANGLKYQEFTVSAANEIQQVAQSMVGKVQAVYIPTDNMLATGMKVVTGVTTQAKLPVFVGESGMVENGGLLTVGINYEELGKQTGAMAAKILKGEAKPADMPIEYQKQYDVSYNSAVAKQLGVTLPESITEKGKDVSAS
ncbi:MULTISPECIES: ABC transporter substrate-binding protein [Caproicibacterium]|uniref:ABC transporter substrate-binding protein n=1 Tax=Caproicibacterium argilliputei TaxID=3030016 RepID=A0AA97H239_9FIRM|nr:ABC transporter substrate-binding protein [Caproicibacterium argilliputei]WOC33118.1 ABC transporter substrate-binding protein [Caproicibacterium argilliputei]